MKPTHTRRCAPRAIACLLASALGAGASAGVPSAPIATWTDSPTTWLYYVVIAIICAATFALSTMSSKRGHQD